ncbi:MAG TPA: hypothetical protein PLV32_08130, partial [Chitinophagaceae bacterium]|nr:hypothetical protein [Chitinophagaceae bacterium]
LSLPKHKLHIVMKRISIVVLTGLALVLISCGGDGSKQKSPEAKLADSLYKDVMNGHDVGMAKMGRLTRAEQTTRRLLDSIKNLPAKAQQSAEPLRIKLDSLQKDLSYAEFAMNKWMEEFNIDSALNQLDQRIEYLKSEKIKVSKVKESILNGLEKADSVLRNKF